MKKKTSRIIFTFYRMQVVLATSERTTENQSPGARFSKVPKLFVPFSGVTIPFVSQERRGFKSSNFTVIFLFVTLKTC